MHTGLLLIPFSQHITALGSQPGQLQSGALACKHVCALIMCLCASVHLAAEETAGAVGVSPFFKAWEEKGKGGRGERVRGEER